jgi:hypothetical protein
VFYQNQERRLAHQARLQSRHFNEYVRPILQQKEQVQTEEQIREKRRLSIAQLVDKQ